MANILFDFDGTIADSTQYHREAWLSTLTELNLQKNLDYYLPYQKGLLERYDSYNRLEKGFLSNQEDFDILSTYFNETNPKILSHLLLDIKESFMLKIILDQKTRQPSTTLAKNLTSSLQLLKDKKHTLGILSSSRRSIVYTFVQITGILKYFTYIMGEEDMVTKSGALLDKPNIYSAHVIKRYVGSIPQFYIGDSKYIDCEFAKNIGAKFILYKYDLDSKIITDFIC